MSKKWTVKDVADRFEEAVMTLRRLPPVKVRGYFNAWPQVIHDVYELLQQEPDDFRLGSPSPSAITRMEETFDWIMWVSIEERKLIWLRAERVPWKLICRQLGVSRNTAWRHWVAALLKITHKLS
nr:hypothetical protein 21 [bacterium]